MADRFFLICGADSAPLIEIIGPTSMNQFSEIVKVMGEDRVLSVLAWGIVVDSEIPDDARSVPPSDINFMLMKVLIRRLLQYVTPYKFDVTDKDPEELRRYVRRAWRNVC